jgi:hypothetical protein
LNRIARYGGRQTPVFFPRIKKRSSLPGNSHDRRTKILAHECYVVTLDKNFSFVYALCMTKDGLHNAPSIVCWAQQNPECASPQPDSNL